MQNAIDKGHVDLAQRNDLLREKFYTSLYSEKLQGQTRHKYDSIFTYETLLMETRAVEHELSLVSCRQKVASVQKVHQNAISGVENPIVVLQCDYLVSMLHNKYIMFVTIVFY